ncbi:thymidylate synthase family protein [Pseudomonas sp. S3_E10]
MAVLFEAKRAVPAWIAAARHLEGCRDQIERNLILEIESPAALTAEDRKVLSTVDEALRKSTPGLSIDTVAGTIFPMGLYKRDQRPDFYQKYLDVMTRAKKPHTWGTYALRMMRRVGRDGASTFNPLETIVRKLKASKEGRSYQAAYELGVIDAQLDIADNTDEFGCELPLYDPATDRNKALNMPCLSHLSFKITDGKLDLTAIYRSQWYGQRALGNLIGLSNLQKFVATESEFDCGVLTCIATHAYLDMSTLGGAKETRAMLKGFPA